MAHRHRIVASSSRYRRLLGVGLPSQTERKPEFGLEISGVIHGVDDEENAVTISMSEAKYVPGLASNLISVTKLAQKKKEPSVAD